MRSSETAILLLIIFQIVCGLGLLGFIVWIIKLAIKHKHDSAARDSDAKS